MEKQGIVAPGVTPVELPTGQKQASKDDVNSQVDANLCAKSAAAVQAELMSDSVIPVRLVKATTDLVEECTAGRTRLPSR